MRHFHARTLLVPGLLLAACMAACLLPGCNTLRGIGEDISAVGDEWADAAEESKP